MLRALLAVCMLQPVLAYSYTQTIDSGPGIGIFFNRPFSVPFTFTSLSPPPGVGVLTVSAFGDINNNVETVDVYFHGTLLGSLFDDQFYFEDPIALTDSLVIPVPVIASAMPSGNLTFNMVVGQNSETSQVRFDSLNLTYPARITEPSTYMMLLAGLGLLGFMARRCRH
jgi:hypothetical protein